MPPEPPLTDATAGQDADAGGAGAPPSCREDPLRLDAQLCFALYAASNRLIRLYRPMLEPAGITYPQYLALLALWERAPRSVGDLSAALGLDTGTLSPLLKRLQAAGLVTRRRDATDERRVLIGLTESARALRQRLADVPARILSQLDLDETALRDLRRQLRRLTSRCRGA